MADYTPIDPTGIAEILSNAAQDTWDAPLKLPSSAPSASAPANSRETVNNSHLHGACGSCSLLVPTASLRQYAYNLLRHGMTRGRLPDLTDRDLENTCQISNSIHRRFLLKAIQNTGERVSFNNTVSRE